MCNKKKTADACFWQQHKPLNARELFHFCEQFSFLLHSGISAAEGLHILIEDTETESSKKMLASIADDFELNGQLSESLKKSGYFPDSMTSYIKIGEETGCLDEIMKNLAAHYQQEIELREQIRHAVSYPFFMLGMMAAVMILLLVKVLPVFQQVFRQMGLELDGFSYKLLKLGNTFQHYFGVFLVLLLLLIGFLLFLCYHKNGRNLLNHAISKIPFVRKIPITIDYNRLTAGIALGLRSGLEPITSLELANDLIVHPVVKGRLQTALSLLNDGAGFSIALTDSGLFQGMDSRLISIGFQAGAADEVMEKIAERYHEKSLSQMEQIVSVIEPTIVIILSVMVGVILLSVMLPLLGILSEMML